MKTTGFLLLLVLAQSALCQVNLERGLKAYYPFFGNALDASGNHNHPVFNNATLTADRFGNARSAYHFNGRNSYMKVLNDPSLNMGSRMSISLWIKPTGFYTGKCYNNMMLAKGDADYLKGNYSLRFSDVYTGCTAPKTTEERFYDGSGRVASTPIVKLNKWYHVIITYDGKNSSLYINCNLAATGPFNGSFTNSFDLYIGRLNSDEYPYWLNGDLDEIRIYDRALNKDEILALCNKMPEPGRPELVPQKNKPITRRKPDSAKAGIPMVTDTDTDSLTVTEIQSLPGIPEKEFVPEKRNTELVKEIIVDHDSVSVTLYDNAEIDGDSVTLIYNEKVITTHQLLTGRPLTFFVKILPGRTNELLMYAENLGSIPPNTALMIITDGDKRYELSVSSTRSSNGMVRFTLRE